MSKFEKLYKQICYARTLRGLNNLFGALILLLFFFRRTEKQKKRIFIIRVKFKLKAYNRSQSIDPPAEIRITGGQINFFEV